MYRQVIDLSLQSIFNDLRRHTLKVPDRCDIVMHACAKQTETCVWVKFGVSGCNVASFCMSAVINKGRCLDLSQAYLPGQGFGGALMVVCY